MPFRASISMPRLGRRTRAPSTLSAAPMTIWASAAEETTIVPP
ncbi:MAG: hypothetical protein ACR2MU_08600 [Gaiellaceae bacterium]